MTVEAKGHFIFLDLSQINISGCVRVIPTCISKGFCDFARKLAVLLVLERGGVPRKNFVKLCSCGASDCNAKNVLADGSTALSESVELERTPKNLLIIAFLIFQWLALIFLFVFGQVEVKFLSVGGIALVVLRDAPFTKFLKFPSKYAPFLPVALILGKVLLFLHMIKPGKD